MTVTARLLDYFLQKRGKRLNILVSTSGDTGAAAIEALRASANMDVFVMYPLGRVTEIQELQMTSAAASADNVHLYARKQSLFQQLFSFVCCPLLCAFLIKKST